MDIEGTLRLEPHLYQDNEFVITVPDWYWSYEGTICIKTPHSAYVIYDKEPNSRQPLNGTRFLRHYVIERGDGEQNPELNPNLLVIKPNPNDEFVYRVLISEKVDWQSN